MYSGTVPFTIQIKDSIKIKSLIGREAEFQIFMMILVIAPQGLIQNNLQMVFTNWKIIGE
ncbi:MAG: hypothetical protein ACYDH1_13285 [Anaerolineaceae bacterium]